MIEMREAARIVWPVRAALVLVKPAWPLEQDGTVNQPNGQAGIRRIRGDETRHASTHEILELEQDRFVGCGLQCLGIAGEQELHFSPQGGERHRQRRAYIGEAAALSERIDLG